MNKLHTKIATIDSQLVEPVSSLIKDKISLIKSDLSSLENSLPQDFLLLAVTLFFFCILAFIGLCEINNKTVDNGTFNTLRNIINQNKLSCNTLTRPIKDSFNRAFREQ